MATSLISSNTIEFNKGKRAAQSLDALKHSDNHQQLKYRLSSVLQSTLDIEQIMEIFRNELKSVVAVDGLIYDNEAHGLKMKTGKKAGNSCGYRLITQEDHLGEISFYRSKRFAESELEIIEVVLSTLICPLRNALRYREALVASLTDPLTGAGNRIALNNTLSREIELSKRHKSPLAMLILDIDDFKKINDSYGHSVGDTVLKSIVSELKMVNRQTDLSFRFGGEEFVVLLNKTSRKGAMVIAQRIRAAIEDMQLELEDSDETFNVTVSIGSTILKRTDSSETMFKRADKALYLAKDAGKNQVVFN